MSSYWYIINGYHNYCHFSFNLYIVEKGKKDVVVLGDHFFI